MTQLLDQNPQVHIAKGTLAKSIAHLREEWQGLETRLQSVVTPQDRGPEPDQRGAVKPMSLMAVELNEAIKQIEEICNQIVDVKARLEI